MTSISQELAGLEEKTTVKQGRNWPRPAWVPERWLIHLLLWIACFVIGFPLLYAMLGSTQTNAQIINLEIKPGSELLDNLRFVMGDRHLGRFMVNSTIQAVIITVGKTVLSLLAGLAFVYFRFRGKWVVFGFVLISLMMPTDIMIIALFKIVSGIGWGDTWYAITVPFLASATGSFLFRQHFANLPAELSEAAQLDGANPLQFLFRVLIPLSWNVMGALAVIQFVYVWNIYLWPLLINKDQKLHVVQVGLNSLFNVGGGQNFPPMMLGAVVASIPPVIVFVVLQKQFMSGFAITRDK